MDLLALSLREGEAHALAAATRCAPLLARYGLSLSEAQIIMLSRRHSESLRAARRVEFGQGILEALLRAFCDSPFLQRHEASNTLADLQDAFYQLKNETHDTLSDEELLQAMTAAFNGRAGGDVQRMIECCLSDEEERDDDPMAD